ncbi:MAG: ImmA/IrrE family metallo-endopeptidase [Desulfosarcina sp.]|nr:ImmA/IrrE family metallo-endopeptidase [Desulfosarcina sp.]MBC2742848.1 ImmA/IrrE family metallo-endopeptidase [Desulfosarcina sp.]MBC2765758.1 ImmA/IrrE family metallo-endopeptidase [Desulfosarcina sp.]
MNRVPVKPELIQWALDRSGKYPDMLAKKLPKIEEWLAGELSPTLKQLETFAKATYTPIGFLFLPEPPDEQVPIPDFRTMAAEYFDRPSPDLLDTIYICQQRQEWYRDFERSMGGDPLPFVGSAQLTDDVIQTAAFMRKALGFNIEERKKMRTWADALRRFIEQADLLGILVMVSGVVGSNNRRKLDPHEFRGFALSDKLAPLVFINGADTKSAQMFTLAHEIAHVWIGETAISDAEAVRTSNNRVERWCNQVAAELLVPLDAIISAYNGDSYLSDEMDRLARQFKVSTLVILRRIHDAGGLTRDELWDAYNSELERLLSIPKGSGGNFYLTQAARVSKRFARALIISTLEGQTLHRDAFRMLGFSKHSTFLELGYSLGVM